MKEIQLTQNKITLVDDLDFIYLSQFNWHYSHGYAMRNVRVPNKHRIYIHRLIMNVPLNMIVDHIDGNTLNNQKSNLRICTHAENIRNQKLNSNNTSGFKGVTWDKNLNKWVAQIKVNQNRIYLGVFIDINKAAEAYNNAAIKYFGEFNRR